ncbi:hypothetical protein PACTADRAFT_22252, partial [Pachysolen tannophilus NRRL Y-2460]
HISESRWTIRNWYCHLHWKNIFLNIILPCYGVIIPLLSYVFGFKLINFCKDYLTIFAINYFVTCLSINIIYHRYYSHKSFKIDSIFFKFFLLLVATSGGVGNAKWWCLSHRAHHRFCDTERDPSNVRKGFWYSHLGWIVLVHHPKIQKAMQELEYEDLNNDYLIKWQHENYFRLFLVFGLILPIIILKQFFLVHESILGISVVFVSWKVFLVQQTFSNINSLCHCKIRGIGSTQPFDNRKTPKNNFLFNLITFGEGNHNFHHEFPSDYRNGTQWYDLDPTKWVLKIFSLFKIVSDLKKTSKTSIDQLLIQQQQKIIDLKRSQLNWGIPIDRLPKITPEQFKKILEGNGNSRALVVVSGIIHDVTPFINDHPGGVVLIKSSIGKDATSAFNGAVYAHSNAAHNLLATMRIAVLKGVDSEQIVWKQQQMENKDIPLKNDSEGKKIVRSGEQVTLIKAHSTTAGAA